MAFTSVALDNLRFMNSGSLFVVIGYRGLL
jgi:hypothetical protein